MLPDPSGSCGSVGDAHGSVWPGFLYDKISSKVISPNRTPPSDVVTRCRDALDIIRDFERSVSPTDVELDLSGDFEELKQILTSPHFKSQKDQVFGG
ncbi:hypothetical protein M8J75_014702 [Diaphorina citri]|nr:hypothetical protein M8J75_014702 [Diaphorina citri]